MLNFGREDELNDCFYKIFNKNIDIVIGNSFASSQKGVKYEIFE